MPRCEPPQLDSDRPVIAVFRSPVFNPTEGFVQAQAAGLIRYQALILGLEDKGNARPELRGRFLLPRSGWERTRVRWLGDAPEFAARLQRAAPALIHAHFATDGLLALNWARKLGVPLVTTLRGYDVTRSIAAMALSGRLSWTRYALGRRRLIQRGDLFLAVSDDLRRKALAAGYPAERTITHYNGVDLERFPQRLTAPEPGLIVHVARLVAKKGTGLLIDALAMLGGERPDARLIILGDGPLRPELERRIAALGLGGRVRLEGMQRPEQVAATLRRAWVLACPSITAGDGDSEGLPNAVIEAAAAGAPVVASRHGGIPEAVIDGETGFLTEEGDAGAIALRLRQLMDTPGLREKMGASARRLAEERFDARAQMARLETLYDRLIEARNCV